MTLDNINWINIEVTPRFYEIDSYGIVNNMFFLGWLEMGRFKIAEIAGLIEERIIKENIIFLVTNIEISYLRPVKFLDTIVVENSLYWKGSGKLIFYHRGKNKKTKDIVFLAKSIVVCTREGNVIKVLPSFVEEKLVNFINVTQKGILQCPEKFFG